MSLLSVSDVARLRGCNHSTAWRLLVALERDHGTKLVRQKRTIHVSQDSLREGLARLKSNDDLRIRRDLREVKRRLSAVEEEIRAFRGLSYEWLRKPR